MPDLACLRDFAFLFFHFPFHRAESSTSTLEGPLFGLRGVLQMRKRRQVGGVLACCPFFAGSTSGKRVNEVVAPGAQKESRRPDQLQWIQGVLV